ncbi:MAG: DUF4476 domain-containing protein [Archangium sp.]|nr:DUF4476 domain-containing protein [Archangium sp.]
MRHLTAGLVVLLSLSAFAQDIPDVEIDVPGAQLKVRQKRQREPEPGPSPAPSAMPPPAVFGADNFAIDYQPVGGAPNKSIQVLTPEGAGAQVWNEDGTLAGQFSVPFTFSGRANTFYRFILFAPDGQLLLDRKYEVKQFLGGTLRMRGAPARASAPVAAGCPESDFAAILSAIDQAGFSEEKIGVVELAARDNLFTVEQVGRMVDAMGFSAEKIKVVELTRRRLVDRQNGFKLLERFSFSADKQKVQALLK